MSDYYWKEDGGILFDPTDEELIQYYLVPKLRGETSGDDFIIDKDVYAKEPWLLEHNPYDPYFKEDEWYYFVTRTQISEKKIGCGKYSKRKIKEEEDGGGSWKTNTTEYIIDKKTKKIIGEKKSLTFIKSENNNKKKQKTGDGTFRAVGPGSDSSWLMTEYSLPEQNKYQELVLCKIYKAKKSKKKGDHHEPSGEEGNMVHQVDAHALKTSSEKDSQAGAILEPWSQVEDNLMTEDLNGNYTGMGFENMEAGFGLTRAEEGNMVHQVDAHALSTIGTVLKTPSEKDSQAGAILEPWIQKLKDSVEELLREMGFENMEDGFGLTRVEEGNMVHQVDAHALSTIGTGLKTPSEKDSQAGATLVPWSQEEEDSVEDLMGKYRGMGVEEMTAALSSMTRNEEGNMVHQVDAHALSTIGTVLKTPSEKDSQAGATLTWSQIEEIWMTDDPVEENYTGMGFENMEAGFGLTRVEEGNMVHQVDALSTVGTVLKTLSEKDSQAGAILEPWSQEMAAALSGMTRDEEDAPNLGWMDQDQDQLL